MRQAIDTSFEVVTWRDPRFVKAEVAVCWNFAARHLCAGAPGAPGAPISVWPKNFSTRSSPLYIVALLASRGLRDQPYTL